MPAMLSVRKVFWNNPYELMCYAGVTETTYQGLHPRIFTGAINDDVPEAKTANTLNFSTQGKALTTHPVGIITNLPTSGWAGPTTTASVTPNLSFKYSVESWVPPNFSVTPALDIPAPTPATLSYSNGADLNGGNDGYRSLNATYDSNRWTWKASFNSLALNCSTPDLILEFGFKILFRRKLQYGVFQGVTGSPMESYQLVIPWADYTGYTPWRRAN
jgi:hypothetical protein